MSLKPTGLQNVLICFDDNYAIPTSVMLTSLFLNNEGVKFNLYAIIGDVTKRNLNAISRLCDKFSRTIIFLDIDKDEYEFFEITHHFSHAAYFRLFAPKMIKADKILYLDVDLIVQTDISPLLEMDIMNSVIAGSLDNNPSADSKERTGLAADEPYINTGVLLINLELWRTQKVTQNLITYYVNNKNKLMWADQDLINKVLAGKKFVLDQQWNMLYGDLINKKVELPNFDRDSFKGIFHFNTGSKPWHNWAKEPYQSLYQKYADLVPILMFSIPKNLDEVLRLTEKLAVWAKQRINAMFLERQIIDKK